MAKEDSTKDEKVVLSKGEFQQLQDDINLLKRSVSQYRLQEQELALKKERGEDTLPRGYCKRIDGELVVSWLGLNDEGSKAEQKILYQGTTPIGEVLIGHYKTIDGKDIVTEASKFYTSTDLEKFTKIGQEGDTWIVRFDNPELPQEYKIHLKFVNP